MENGRLSIYQLALRTFTPEGTLRAASRLLSHVAALGFTHVQLTPVTEAEKIDPPEHWSKRQAASGMNNPYNPYILKDYYRIDPEYGSEEDLKAFIREAHRVGLKVLLDLVYYHCGRHATILTEHPAWMKCGADGKPAIGQWNTPSPDYANPETRRYMWDNMTYFIREYDCDGYRCDVGDLVPFDFWQEGIRRCRSLKNDVVFVNEGREKQWLEAFDCNYFYEGCFDMPKIPQGLLSAAEWRALWQQCRGRLGENGRVLRFLDNHDVCSDSGSDRIEKVVGHEGMEALHVLNFTLDGVPFVFCGNEIADDLKHSMFSSRFYGRDDTLPWENVLRPEGIRRMTVIKALNGLRAREEALNTTDLRWIENDCEDAVLSFVRPGRTGDILVVINLRDEPKKVRFRCRADRIEPRLEKDVRACPDGEDILMQMLGYGYLAAAI